MSPTGDGSRKILWRHAINSYQGYRPGDSVNLAVGRIMSGIETDTHLIPTLAAELPVARP